MQYVVLSCDSKSKYSNKYWRTSAIRKEFLFLRCDSKSAVRGKRLPHVENWGQSASFEGRGAPSIIEANDMEARDFYKKEAECELKFRELGPCYHLCTGENSPVIFHDEREYKVAMNIIALSASLFSDIKMLTFEVMSNHLHFALCGDSGRILEWYGKMVALLRVHIELKTSRDTIASLREKLIAIESLDNLRNVIVYINRNGYIADSGHTPFSYPWGANRFFFNDEAKIRYESLKVKPTARWKRNAFHSNLGDNLTALDCLDGYVSPMCFCCISLAEGLFISAHQYFSKVSRCVESSAVIAKQVGESLYYTDSELYSIVVQKCSKQYGCPSPAMISADAKVAVARMMRYDYNSSAKQISRILRMEIETVRRMFPEFG